MLREYHLAALSDTERVAAYLATNLKAPCIIYLHGELGTGKTTLVRAFLRAKGVTGRIKSPTYTLIEPYDLPNETIFHFDLYRLNSAEELDSIGIDEYFTSSSICFIEWPEKAEGRLPPPDVECFLSYAGDERVLRLKSIGK
jgi:tRNA threonylcarbamoyladenosine biosynthesis protein TsaE